jgi:phosphinothricin acetyltransferase
VDVSAYVRPDQQRRGIGRALYTFLLRLLPLQGYYNAYAGIALPNPASVGLHEAMGFRPVGIYRQVGYKLGAWHDVGWWQLPLQEHTKPAEPPLPLAVAQETVEWQQTVSSKQ